MIGIVLVTHGHLASEFRAALEHVVGPQKQIESIAIGPDDDIEQRRQDIVSAVAKVDSGNGVVVLTDMFGGTPSNLAISIMNDAHIEVIAGVNLPMLIKLGLVAGQHQPGTGRDPGPGRGPQVYLCRKPGLGRKMSSENAKPADIGDCPEFEAPEDVLVRTLEIVNRKGLHARATAKLVQCIDGFDVAVTVSRCGETVGGTSIMGILTLGAGPGMTK